ncbi:MAG: phenylalanine--tRNA ligase subunit beta [Fusobacteriota bacterium]
MLISLNWLNQYVKIEDKGIKELENALTMIGQEVEKIDHLGENLDDVVIGKITKLEDHPNADKLTLCQVNVGEDENLSIICGAPNHREGDKVAVAKVGAELPGGFKIKKAKIRGVQSVGMICSGKELGISEDSDGVIILDKEAPIGEELKKYLDIDDVVFELEITPNRPDCLSHLGIARELSAYYGRELILPDTAINEDSESTADNLDVEIKNKDLSKRYATRIIKDIEIKESPKWLKSKLQAMGLKSINNVVDVTNYVLMETGHPMHAFDYSKIDGKKITVRNAMENEKIETLDGELRELNKDTLVISDEKKALAMAGIMGGANSEVTDDTKDIVLEVAHFNPENIRQSSKDYKLSTDASYRFERGIDIADTEFVINRAAKLIQEVAGGRILKGILEEKLEEGTKSKVTVNLDKINKFIGKEIEAQKIYEILNGLNMEVIKKEDNNIEVIAPTYRLDIERKADIYEEITRMYGFENIEPIMPKEDIKSGKISKDLYNTRRVKKELRNLGLQEVINYSFISEDSIKILKKDEKKMKETVSVKNPISEEMALMRPTLEYSLLTNIKDNFNNNIEDLKIFEVGKVYFKEEEKLKIGISLAGSQNRHIWESKPKQYDFYKLKGYLEELFESVGLSNYKLKVSSDKTYHPGRVADIFVGHDCIGTFGEIHPDVLDNMKIKNRVYLAQIDMEKLLRYSSSKINYEEIIKYPAVDRDLAVVLEEDKMVGDLVEDIENIDNIVESVELFDIYAGENIKDGYKNVALNIKFRSKKGTLKEKKIKEVMDKILKKISDDYNGELRS